VWEKNGLDIGRKGLVSWLWVNKQDIMRSTSKCYKEEWEKTTSVQEEKKVGKGEVKLPLCIITHHTMKAYRQIKV
jgi:hypothetical protein